MYDGGIGTRMNEYEAIRWYKKAAAKGDEDAIEALKENGYLW